MKFTPKPVAKTQPKPAVVQTTETAPTSEKVLLLGHATALVQAAIAGRDAAVNAVRALDNAIGWKDYQWENVLGPLYEALDETEGTWKSRRNRWQEREDQKAAEEAAKAAAEAEAVAIDAGEDQALAEREAAIA